MGDYRIELDLTGGHGCNREAKEGEAVTGCGRIGCPDCETKAFIAKLCSTGSSFRGGRFINWPGQDANKRPDGGGGEIVDEISGDGRYPQVKRVKGHF